MWVDEPRGVRCEDVKGIMAARMDERLRVVAGTAAARLRASITVSRPVWQSLKLQYFVSFPPPAKTLIFLKIHDNIDID